MPKQIIIAEQHRIAAVFSEDQIQELVVATGTHQVSDIYLGVVENVIPGIDAAFVNIGDPERNGFMHVTDLGPLRLKRSAGAITELLVPQQKVLVQVMKEPTGNKGPRLTGNITLPGRYLVLMPFGKGVHLSRRIVRESERNRLRALAILVKPSGMGLLVRTEAESVGEDAIMEDLETLQKQWETVQEEYNTNKEPTLLNRDDDFIQRVLRDMYSTDVNRIVVDSHTGLKRVKQQLTNWNGGKLPQGVFLDHHRESQPILEYFRVNAAIREALKPRVDLPSGGYIIIEPTEALTVIDVNSGSFTRSATSRETVLWTNCEAATEIARQLRLRNVAGVIIVDFIDMDSRRDQLQVLEQFTNALSADKARPQIAQLSELGLIELTRKRQGQNIYELFSRPCSACGGLGHIVQLPGEEAPHQIETVAPTLTPTPTPTPTPAVALPRERSKSRPTKAAEKSLETVREAVGDSELDPAASDTQELDLIHHPSYQELGDGGTRRRRRRRFPSPETKSEPETTPKAAPTKEESRSSRPEAPILDESRNRETTEVDTEDKGGRSRSISRESKPEEPVEVVTVEMTSEEQEVYALMGISPLIKLDRPVKNPKSVIVEVIAPGQVSETQTGESNGGNSHNGTSHAETPPSEEVDDRDDRSGEDETANEVNEQPADLAETQDTPKSTKTRTNHTRRRRRRSSASSE
ncbi:Rne/Rng family ribonuclease [Geitlerinema sp. CS-897]|nr:Rne/Rng family ribonuclease [Geitlerinema sp. CS-897]